MEEITCDDCGEKFFVHSHYVDFPFQKAEVFKGYCEVEAGAKSIKTYIKLKKILACFPHTNAMMLEEQYLQKLLIWDIGNFYGVERDRVIDECQLHGIAVWFARDNAD